MGIMKHKKVKALLSAALVLSLVGGNNLSYVGAKNQQDIENTLKIEEQTNNAEQESEAEKEIPKEENEIPKEENDQMQSTPEESVEKDHIEDVEVIPAMPETESEKAETLEKNPEKVSKYGDEIPEITDRAVLMEGRNNTVGNYDDVCLGGGNDKPTKKTYNQNPKVRNPITGNYYWRYDNPTYPFEPYYSEQRLIDKIWPKNIGDANNHGYRLPDAVIDPDSQCFYANRENGFGESLGNNIGNERYYVKYNSKWNNPVRKSHTPNPLGSATIGGKPISPPVFTDLSYTGNWRWQQGGTNRPGGYLFTIVTRPILKMGSATYYYDKEAKKSYPQFYADGKSHPRVYDNTEDVSSLVNPEEALFKFEGYRGNAKDKVFYSGPGGGYIYDGKGYYNAAPRDPGWYNITIQSKPREDMFMLPGVTYETAVYMKKGYLVDFVQTIDRKSEQPASWRPSDEPTAFDADTKNMFGVDMYLEGSENKIPIPQYDESKFIFEGWDVEEQYWEEPTSQHPHGRILTKTKSLDRSDEIFIYRPSAIGRNQYFVLQAKLIARLKTRKTDTINPVTKVIDGETIQGGIAVSPSNITVTEEIPNAQMFEASVNNGYAYEFVGWSYNENGSHSDLGVTKTYKPNPDFTQQTEVHKTSTLYATFKPKEYTITFDGNGGTDSTKSSTTSTQTAKYYNDVQLAKNPFVREGFEFKGWSKMKNGSVDFADQGNGRNIPLNGLDKAPNNDIPTEITLYAVWERNIAEVDIEKYKDTLWIEGASQNAMSNNIYVHKSSQGYNAYEITRFYVNVDVMGAGNVPDKLKKDKFYVVWERSIDNGNSWEKIPLSVYNKFFTAPFTNNRQVGYSKVVYDEQKGRWFVPLLVRANQQPTQANVGGQYRVNVAYDDPQATKRVASEQDFFDGTGNIGWTTSEPTEIKMISTFDTVIKVPSTITLAETTEVSQSGEKTDVIKSVPYVNEVTVNPVRHTIDGKTDYDWHTPNTAMDGKTTQSNSYNGGQYTEYTKQKPFKVSVNWDKTLTDTTKQYTVNTVEMYSAENIGTMKKDQKITTGTQSTFSYDGQESGKKLFSFYLKGEKPKHLPEGVLFKGQITFVIDNVR